MRASTHLRRPNKPYFGTAFALATLVILILMFVGTIFLVPVLGGSGQICTSGFAGPVMDPSGNVVREGYSIPETCTGSGSFDWTPLVVMGVFALVIGGGIWANVAQIRRYARRWDSPFYYPVMWTALSGLFLALLLSVVRRPWVESQATTCDSSRCFDLSSDFSLVGSLILWAVIAVVLIPFLLSLRRLISVWRSPARFIYRRRRR